MRELAKARVVMRIPGRDSSPAPSPEERDSWIPRHNGSDRKEDPVIEEVPRRVQVAIVQRRVYQGNSWMKQSGKDLFTFFSFK